MMFSLTYDVDTRHSSKQSRSQLSKDRWGGGEPGRMDVAATAICKESDYESTRKGRNLGAPIMNSFITMPFTLATM